MAEVNKKKKSGKKRKKDKKGEKEEKKEEKREEVYVDINDILERAKEEIMATHGGISYTEIEYIGDVDKLKFTIPKIDRKGKCQEINSPDEEGGCGETGGACICEKDEDHEDEHKCEFCGHEW